MLTSFILHFLVLNFSSFYGMDSKYAITQNRSFEHTIDIDTIGIGSGIVDGNFIGGFDNCSINQGTRFKMTIPKNAIRVNNNTELLSTLSKANKGDVIYLNDKSTFNLTTQENIGIPEGVTLMSGRGINKSEGALIFTDQLKTWPLFQTMGPNVRLIGLRIKGPDSSYVNSQITDKFSLKLVEGKLKGLNASNSKMPTYGLGNSNAIAIKHATVLIQNCEIYQWSHAGIRVLEGGDVKITHNYIHSNQRYGLGYGIVLDKGKAFITANLFKNNRHAISGTGAPTTSYKATYNIVMINDNVLSHQFDMHGGKDRKDGTNIAGNRIEISNNLFYYKNGPAILIRGVPQDVALVTKNVFVKYTQNGNRLFTPNSYQSQLVTDRDTLNVIKQVNSFGNFVLLKNKYLK